ncbi:MAG: hypothetical protein OXR64_08610 [Chloroflexota bacterium]|nr:hypothetical protein [Chloroflexota bacterium]
MTLPPVAVVQPPPLPTNTPKPTASPPTAASASGGAPRSPAAAIQFETWGPRVLLNAFREIEQEFRKAIPWITVQARLDNALTSDRLRTRLRKGQGPDVSRIEPEDVFDFTAAGFLHGLGARVDMDSELREAAPGAPAARTGAGGELSTLSIGATHQCVLYNSQHLESVGVAAPMSWESPWTVAEFEEAARRLVIASNQRVERFGLTAIPAYARPVLAQGSDDFLDAEQRASTLATPERQERLQRLTGWQTTLAIELPTAFRFVAPFSGAWLRCTSTIRTWDAGSVPACPGPWRRFPPGKAVNPAPRPTSYAWPYRRTAPSRTPPGRLPVTCLTPRRSARSPAPIC